MHTEHVLTSIIINLQNRDGEGQMAETLDSMITSIATTEGIGNILRSSMTEFKNMY